MTEEENRKISSFIGSLKGTVIDNVRSEDFSHGVVNWHWILEKIRRRNLYYPKLD